MKSGFMCAANHQINLNNVTYCYTNDNSTCFKDKGALCNYTDSQAWCNLNFTQKNVCSSGDFG